MFKKATLLLGIFVTCSLLWFAVYDYRQAGPIARENLRGVALTLTSAIEQLAINDPSLSALASFHPGDVAYFALIDGRGVYRFHSNSDLIGSAAGSKPAGGTALLTRSESRVVLGTGEQAYRFTSPIDLHGDHLSLVLTLHTHRADAVIRRARLNATIVVALLAAGWLLSAGLVRYARREERHQEELSRRETLAKLGEMGAVLAHEIRNPLAGIKGFAQVIAARPQAARNASFAQSIVTEAVRLENLVNDLLAYAAKEPAAGEAFSIAALLEHTVSLLKPEAAGSGIGITTDCRRNLVINGNRDRIEQAMLNLGRNALQAMPEGGELRLTATMKESKAVITFEDTGHGIAEEHRALVFEPFFTTRARGTGLGLALCKKIVEGHGGSIALKSRTGAGTTVTVTLPCSQG